jgi:hypothetical protein
VDKLKRERLVSIFSLLYLVLGLRPCAIYSPVNRILKGKQDCYPNLSSLSQTSRRQRGKTSPTTTDRGFLGPATLGPDAFDNYQPANDVERTLPPPHCVQATGELWTGYRAGRAGQSCTRHACTNTVRRRRKEMEWTIKTATWEYISSSDIAEETACIGHVGHSQ